MASVKRVDDVSTLTNVDGAVTSTLDGVSEVDGGPNPKTAIVTISNTEAEADEGQASTAPRQKNLKNGGKGNESEKGPSWEGEARLYCIKNGRPHSVLVDFGYSKCPKCEDDLTQPEHISGETTTKEDDDGQHPSDSPKFSFMIEYQDQGGHIITTETWGKPFDLQAARGTSAKEPIFEVVTVLGTTIPGNKYRFKIEVKEIMDEGILTNSKIGVTLMGAKMVIKSPEIVRAITKVATYYPSVDMEGDTITIHEPYPLIAHHMEQLEAYGKSLRDTTAKELVTETDGGQTNVQSNNPSKNFEATSVDIDLLLDYIKNSVYKNDIRDELSRYDNGITCTFRMLWLLFKPGDKQNYRITTTPHRD